MATLGILLVFVFALRLRRAQALARDAGDALAHASAELATERRLFDASPLCVFACEARPPHRVLRASGPHGAALVGQSLTLFLHDDDLPALAECVQRSAGGTASCGELRVRLPGDGDWRRQRLHLLVEDPERPSTLRGWLLDIDALWRAEAEAASRSEALQAAVLQLGSAQRLQQMLLHLTDRLQTAQTPEDAGGIVSRAGRELFPRWDAGALTFADADGRMQVAAQWGDDTAVRGRERESDCWAVRRAATHLCGLPRPRFELPDPACAHFGTTDGRLPEGVLHTICTPLDANGERAGALHLVSRHPINEETLRQSAWAAETVADALQLSYANLRLRTALREQAVRDALTGLYNRRYFDESLRRETSRAEREHEGLTLGLLDIDHFKSFNDAFGHAAGDDVLRAVAAQLHGFVRSYDIACRIGGEELAVLMPRATLEETCTRLDALRSQISQMEVRHDGAALPPVTVSIGVAALGQGEPRDLVRHADRALYAAKRGGRNRVQRWDEWIDARQDRH